MKGGVPPEAEGDTEDCGELALQEQLWNQWEGGVGPTVQPNTICYESEFSLTSYDIFPVSTLSLRDLLMRNFLSQQRDFYA